MRCEAHAMGSVTNYPSVCHLTVMDTHYSSRHIVKANSLRSPTMMKLILLTALLYQPLYPNDGTQGASMLETAAPLTEVQTLGKRPVGQQIVGQEIVKQTPHYPSMSVNWKPKLHLSSINSSRRYTPSCRSKAQNKPCWQVRVVRYKN